jgi:hypothetical protein
MANRHSHKKLRAEIRDRMISTGEGYQTARQRILACTRAGAYQRAHLAREDRKTPAVDLIPLTFFGLPVTLAIGDAGFFNTVTVIRHAPKSLAFPLVAWLRPRGMN